MPEKIKKHLQEIKTLEMIPEDHAGYDFCQQALDYYRGEIVKRVKELDEEQCIVERLRTNGGL